MFMNVAATAMALFAIMENGMCSSGGLPDPLTVPINKSQHLIFEMGVLFFPEGFDFSKILSQMPGAKWKPMPKVSSPQIPSIGKKVDEAIAPMLEIPPELDEAQQHHEMADAEVVDTTEQLQISIEAIDDTLAYAANPTQLSGLLNLPEQNRIMLLDFATRLVAEGKTGFSALRDALQGQFQEAEPLTFDVAADTISFGLQTEKDDYKKYTQVGHQENLAHFVHCLVVSKGYQMQKLDSPIALEDLQILIQRAITHSGYAGHSEQLLELAKRLESMI